MMKCKEQVWTELLFEFDDICRNNGLTYSIIGREAAKLIEEKALPEKFNGVSVAMTIGDVEKLTKIVNLKPERKLEYYLTNNNARDFGMRFYNTETTYIDVRDFRNHTEYGYYIEIIEIERVPAGKAKKKAALVKKICKGTNINNYTIRNTKNIILSVFIKMIQAAVGKKRFKKTLYDFNKKYTGIKTWEQIEKYKKVRLGVKVFNALDPNQIENIDLDDKIIMVLKTLAEEGVKEYFSDQYYEKYIISDSEHPYDMIMDKAMYDDMKSIVKGIDSYAAKQRSSAEAKSNIRQAWDMYLMSREIVEQKRNA